MKKWTLLTALCLSLLMSACLSPKKGVDASAQPATSGTSLKYTVDVTDLENDVFKVRLDVDDLTTENAVYQFASTAPGTYQVMNIGRFVRSFKAFDANGSELATEQASTNQWKISNPEATTRIEYTIADIWDTEVNEHPIYAMAASSLEADYAQILPHAVLGYPTGMQARPLAIALEQPSDWIVGSALATNAQGHLLADDYDHAVDSPILTGKLTYASMEIYGGKVDFYAYSKSGQATAQMFLEETRDVVESVAAFLEGFPVDRYTFLFLLDDNGSGAWEHSYSSNYAFPDGGLPMMKRMLDGITAHEIFHIVTPLNIHSEIIEQFNFVEPVPSQHLWLYEATTEWAAGLMRLRSGAMDIDEFFAKMREKLTVSDFMKKDLSLTELAMTSFTKDGAKQYGNIYMRGAVTMTLLDIRLLELSNGKRGLREVLMELASDYGKEKAFSEAGFFDDFIARTHPEVRDFFARYVQGHEPLPLEEYFGKLGITYTAEVDSTETQRWLGFVPMPVGDQIHVTRIEDRPKAWGLAENDVILSIDDIEMSMDNLAKVSAHIGEIEIGSKYEVVVRREDGTHNITLEMLERKRQGKHLLELDEAATPQQIALREVWSKNMPLKK